MDIAGKRLLAVFAAGASFVDYANSAFSMLALVARSFAIQRHGFTGTKQEPEE
jgi:hypothetical protein